MSAVKAIYAGCKALGIADEDEGWAISWDLVTQRPIRRWSKEARARVRRQNLRRRIEKKFPLFAEDFIADELARRPQYFAGET